MTNHFTGLMISEAMMPSGGITVAQNRLWRGVNIAAANLFVLLRGITRFAALARSMRADCEIATIPATMMTIPRIENAAMSFLATERLERRIVWIP